MTPHERFCLACNELGWGDPKGGLWFFGIEEAAAWKNATKEDVERHYDHGKYFRDWEVERKIPREIPLEPSKGDVIEARIAWKLSRSGKSRDNILKAISKIECGTGIAHGNLYPLGKPRANSPFPSHYTTLFGFDSGSEEWKRYKKEIEELRYDRIRKARTELKPQAIVCFGKGCWPEFRKVFGLGESNDKDLQVFDDGRTVLAPHWSFGHLEKHVEKISKILKTWGVEIP